ncbi:hypothetical protein QLS71_011710 [Mariniflexile litorale]|uniref:Lipoprotein n=1 Tax=Mariniflexile litorale TaxID=3045158 RepID=A0AAU7EBT2_9FLAO|nr:hypothetical protein [Mariniflexile sp. KMM 9835]MDQ8213015.1 hypothetical protein [Mariniflexile sp. KMM 9835]
MNKSIFILILVLLLVSCKENSKEHNAIINDFEIAENEYQKYTQENGWIRMSEITVKEFITELKFGNDNELNILSTIGQTDKNWITNSDLKFLISQIESKEKAKCVNRVISSFIPDPKNMTIGDQVISIIEAYRKNEPYPNELYICESYDKEKVNEILEWWKQKNGS